MLVMKPSFVDIVPHTTIKVSDSFNEMRARHSCFVDSVALTDPTVFPYIELDFKIVISIIFCVRYLYRKRTSNL